MNGPIRRLTYGIFIGFGVLALEQGQQLRGLERGSGGAEAAQRSRGPKEVSAVPVVRLGQNLPPTQIRW